MATRCRRVLVLGGTGEAFRLAEVASRRAVLDVTTSFAGRTRRPRLPPGRIRIGGFGGAAGLGAYLARTGTAAVVDATHPFAERISAHAREACASVGRPLCVLARPSWPEGVIGGARWVRDLGDALTCAATAAGRILITFNPGRLDGLHPVPGNRLVVRSIEVASELPPGARWIPFLPTAGSDDERRLLERLGIGAVISKASGGAATVAKLTAAATLGLPVVLIRRPDRPAVPVVEGVDDAVAWLLTRNDALRRRGQAET